MPITLRARCLNWLRLALFISTLWLGLDGNRAPVLAADGTSPQDALKLMQVADGFEVALVACEPEIRQPLSIAFDDRGRMWVIQYLQYPTPAGLKPVSVDNYLRTKYDRVPEPPPRGPKGVDRITICELSPDRRHAVRYKDFVTGLNLCSGLALGHGGVFVLQPPYLLFYPDRNGDDIPDADPEVLLTGFGMEDAHAVANSLTWGPDGWLYGAQGSTVTARIRNLEFQQGIWRYHPLTKKFELFAEGGGNTWGLDFDDRGEILAGTNFDDKMLHQIQGAYYVKNFGKHGALHNPFTYGYFDHVPYTGYRGRHISCGGIVYQGGAFPERFNGAYIFANVLDHAVYWADLKTAGSSFTASFGGPLLKTDDELFRPVDCEVGPDGAVYIADWCDRRASHVDPLDTWDRSNGRIYRVAHSQPRQRETPGRFNGQGNFDLEKLTSQQLVDLLQEPNAWFARRALVLLAERRDSQVWATLKQQLMASQKASLALRSLWGLYVSGGFQEKLVPDLLRHPNENVRAWTVRLLGDDRKIPPGLESSLRDMARSDPSPVVRSQLACSVKRWSGNEALPLIAQLLTHDEDRRDAHIPLLLWWALEDKAITFHEQVLKLFSSATIWRHGLTREFVLERLCRRYADEGTETGLASCGKLLELAPDDGSRLVLLRGLEEGLTGRKLQNPPASLQQWFARVWPDHQTELPYVQLGLRLEDARARATARALLDNSATPEAVRLALIGALAETGNPEDGALLMRLAGQAGPEKIREAALSALQHYATPEIGASLLGIYPQLSKHLQTRTLALLCSRAPLAELLVNAVDDGRIQTNSITLAYLKQMTELNNVDLTRRIEQRWGRVRNGSPEEKLTTINRLKLVLNPSGVVARDARGNFAEGKKVFQTTCAVCHKLFGEGNSVGPELTSADRKNTDYLLAQIVDPSGYIRPEFVAYQAHLKDDSILDGLIVESTSSSVTLVDRNNERHVLARGQIAELKESTVSLMPEGLLEALTPEALMNLFAYLQADESVASRQSGSASR